MNSESLEFVKFDHHARKMRSKPIDIGKFRIAEVSHNEWEVSTQDGKYLDTFTRRDHAVAYARALKSR